MAVKKQLSPNYTELWQEYLKFLEMNNLRETDISKVCFIYTDRMLNMECVKCNPKLSADECCMYNWTIDDDCNRILVDNDYGTIYAKINNDIIAFRCTNYCLKSKSYRFLNQWIVNKKNTSSRRLDLLNF